MKVRILKEHYRTRYGQELRRGEIVDLPEHIALKLVSFGLAASIEEPEAVTDAPAPIEESELEAPEEQPEIPEEAAPVPVEVKVTPPRGRPRKH